MLAYLASCFLHHVPLMSLLPLRALSHLEGMFVGRQQAGAGTSGQKQKPMSLLIVDEIDILMTKDQSVSHTDQKHKDAQSV